MKNTSHFFKKRHREFSTEAIHHAYDPRDNQGSLNPPMHLSSTFTFEDAQHGTELFAGERQGHFYSRVSNPTIEILEKRLAKLEGAEASVAAASGMAAITACFWTLLKAGDEVIVDKTLYGCTHAFLTKGLAKFDIRIKHVDMTNIAEVEQAISKRTRILYFETPSNPNMRLVDIRLLASMAKRNNAICIVDSTYATPYITRPIELGADLVIHSATKYLGGHGDLIAGMVVGSQALINDIRCLGIKDMTGACMSPFTAMLILRGLKTLELRMLRHSENAQKVAHFLESHHMVEKVYYPGLESFEQSKLAHQQMSLFGGMIAFELKGGMYSGRALMDSLSLVQCAVSLGDAESLIQHPASMTHSTYPEDERLAHGISDSLVRLSVGLESANDIIQDLAEGLDCIAEESQTEGKRA